ncbi:MULTISPECIES: type IV toxin-antitoxin system AbiEi family antitoxin domain-containing protein [unclassified Gordonia (in: high G+C Gram-positive bacteria)]|uniref:type IV toxin-antitoxin system AbiEi family antitoxin domain-containing protein n=1 Tax=unclassified Gordonia (in: high G+C Gram-positive bacteria) TaxID=2657482 RepID=UPI001F053BC0|nr:type IV toxin-antitoxin system AbiEi family antitoxin domain-containing protein [Gordonia sp. PDNC005]
MRAARFLADHDGVITTAQARDLGMTRGQLRARTERGLWVAHARSTFLSAEHRMTDMARVRIVANGYAGAVVDRTAAAWLHGLTKVLPDEVTLSLPRSSHVVDSCTVPASVCRRTVARPSNGMRVRGECGPPDGSCGPRKICPNRSWSASSCGS